MRVLFLVSGPDGDRLVDEADLAGNDVQRCDDEATASELAARIRREPLDVVVVDAEAKFLTMDVVDTCDARGIMIVALVYDRATADNATQCGVTETAPSWEPWTSIVRRVVSASEYEERGTILERDAQRTAPMRHVPDRHLSGQQETGRALRSIDGFPTENGAVERKAGQQESSFTPTRRSPRVVSVWGPTGAPGRTTLVVNLAVLAAKAGQSVAVIDADTYGAAVAIRLGIFDEAPGIARACRLAGADSLTESAIHDLMHRIDGRGFAFDVMTGILGTARWPEISRERLAMVIESVSKMYDVVIVDVGFSLETDEEISSDLLAPRRNGATLTVLRASTDIVAVSAADSVGLARFIRLWSDVVEANDEATITVAVNRVNGRREGTSAHDNIAAAFSRFAGIRDVVLVPESVDLLMRADVRAEPACVIDPASRFSAALTEIARRASLVIEAESTQRRWFERGLRLLG